MAVADKRKAEARRHRAMMVKKPPYDRMKQAVEVVEGQHPGADRYVPGFSYGDVYVEVWKDGHATAYFVDGI